MLEDAGWNTHQFHAATEFYADYGVYDVRITVPRGVRRRRHRAARSARTDNARRHDDAPLSRRGHPRLRVDGEPATSSIVTRTFEHPTLPPVEMRLLLQPEHAGQEERHFAATAAALKHYGEWFGAYPYGHITIVDPAFQSGSDGMEYPTLFTGRRALARAARRVADAGAVTIHEAGHQWWYGMVGSNEFEHAWMDEGHQHLRRRRG